MAERVRALTVAQERFVIQYVAGTDEQRGNGTRCYLEAFPNTTNEKIAGSCASRLLKRASVRARMQVLRDEAEAASKARLRSWMSMAPEAQNTLERAMRGEWPAGWSDEAIRSALKAAQDTLDRALGNVKQMHAEGASGQTINVFVAAGITPNDQQAVQAAPIPLALAYTESG